MSTDWPSYRSVNYAIRPAKNVERKMMAEVLQCLAHVAPLSEYQYVGFGSIYFADYRLFHRSFGMQRMVSIEGNESDEERVRYNSPFDCVDVRIGKSCNVLPLLDWNGRSIVWLDYDHELVRYVLEDVDLVCSRVTSGSVLAVTLDGETKRLKEPKALRDDELENWPKERRRQFERLVGRERVSPELQPRALQGKSLMTTYRHLLQNEIKNTYSAKNLGEDEADRWHFDQIFNFRYADKAQMMTLGWIVYQERDAQLIRNCRFDAHPFYRSSDTPLEIAIPNLTFREMRGLDRFLPTRKDNDGFNAIPVPDHDKELYQEIYRFFPTFAEADL